MSSTSNVETPPQAQTTSSPPAPSLAQTQAELQHLITRLDSWKHRALIPLRGTGARLCMRQSALRAQQAQLWQSQSPPLEKLIVDPSLAPAGANARSTKQHEHLVQARAKLVGLLREREAQQIIQKSDVQWRIWEEEMVLESQREAWLAEMVEVEAAFDSLRNWAMEAQALTTMEVAFEVPSEVVDRAASERWSLVLSYAAGLGLRYPASEPAGMDGILRFAWGLRHGE